MSYSVDELIGIVADTGMEEALKEISHESIEDPTLKEYWEEARLIIEKIELYLEDMAIDDDLDEDDIDYGDDDDDESYD